MCMCLMFIFIFVYTYVCAYVDVYVCASICACLCVFVLCMYGSVDVKVFILKLGQRTQSSSPTILPSSLSSISSAKAPNNILLISYMYIIYIDYHIYLISGASPSRLLLSQSVKRLLLQLA